MFEQKRSGAEHAEKRRGAERSGDERGEPNRIGSGVEHTQRRGAEMSRTEFGIWDFY